MWELLKEFIIYAVLEDQDTNMLREYETENAYPRDLIQRRKIRSWEKSKMNEPVQFTKAMIEQSTAKSRLYIPSTQLKSGYQHSCMKSIKS